MKRPLIGLISAILLSTILSFSPTTAYSDEPTTGEDVVWLVCEITAGCDLPAIAVVEITASETSHQIDKIKSSLRAGVAVGKSVARTACVVVESLALAAHHGATALVSTAFGVF